jgi:alkanesulfonate monooxygenase SsuD/methylene tetrahydromethanopterin reductase-like flavin-dependent oxidoreductase (luciferase family)
VRFGFKTYQYDTTWPNLLELWRTADDIDIFESGWLFDHHYAVYAGPDGLPFADSRRPCLETWTTLTALAQATRRLRLGVIVAGVVNHPAPLIAKMAATVDHIADGRLELGLGAGSMATELESYGIRLGSVTERLDRWEEALHVIVSLFTQDEVDFAGQYYTLRAARCNPKPLQRPHPPICIGARGERRGLKIAARWAQLWNCAGGASAGPGGFVRKSEILSSYCQEIGRDPNEVRRSVDFYLDSRADPAVLTDVVPTYAEAGVDLLVVGLAPPYDPSRVVAVAERLTSTSARTHDGLVGGAPDHYRRRRPTRGPRTWEDGPVTSLRDDVVGRPIEEVHQRRSAPPDGRGRLKQWRTTCPEPRRGLGWASLRTERDGRTPPGPGWRQREHVHDVARLDLGADQDGVVCHEPRDGLRHP